MRKSQPSRTTSQRAGLQATVPCYLKDVVVDDDGFIIDFAVAFLPDDVDPAEVKRAVQDALNLDEPHRCEVYDGDERYLAGHPGTPNNQSGRLAEIIEQLDQRAHVMPARLDLSRHQGERVAQIIADPLYEPVVGRGPAIPSALAQLLEHKIDWRRVRH